MPQACASATPALRQWLPKLSSYAAEAHAFLSSDAEQPEQSSSRQQTLGELLLGLPPPQVRGQQLLYVCDEWLLSWVSSAMQGCCGCALMVTATTG